jgi:hypothetical protein
MPMLGVPGRLTHRTTRAGQAPGLWFKQRWVSDPRPISGYGSGGLLQVEVRYDDELGNGRNSFAITATVTTPASIRQGDTAAGGCLHGDIARVFPELAPLIRWHLFDSDGPMHYIENTLYHASDRDHNGLTKGERQQIRNGKTGKLAWKLEKVGPDVDAPAHIYADEQPTPPDVRLVYVPWERIGEGKERDLKAARSCAAWPDATDEQLCAPRETLRAALEARLPALMAEFRAAIVSAGFALSPADLIA